MAELVDAPNCHFGVLRGVRVRVPLGRPKHHDTKKTHNASFLLFTKLSLHYLGY